MVNSPNYYLNEPGSFFLQAPEPAVEKILNDFSSSLQFHRQLKDYRPSPLHTLHALANKLGVKNIFLKNEGERFGIPAVKMLGASYAMHQLVKMNPGTEVFCTATDGNHGRSVARSARLMNRKAMVFVPDYTVETRIKNIADEGAEVFRIKGNYDSAVDAAREYADEQHALLIQDMAWEDYLLIPALITAGYYTQQQELLRQLKPVGNRIDLIILQCGNGTWPSSVCYFLKKYPFFENTKILLVEPATSDSMLVSLQRGKVSTTKKSQKTLMAGLNCGTPSTLAYGIIQSAADAAIGIEDDFALKAMKLLYYPVGKDPQIEAGESGAAGLAGLIAITQGSTFSIVRDWLGVTGESKVLIYATENITDPETFKRFVS